MLNLHKVSNIIFKFYIRRSTLATFDVKHSHLRGVAIKYHCPESHLIRKFLLFIKAYQLNNWTDWMSDRPLHPTWPE
ncbi:unnamed protein product [Blepharisma stoltei]|uniref:Uncharacterized protein n=1 Tax=Blepharisma stoltei TaxID=1481888 RepID=A0AAU9IVN7_9CILI|nr:unnamed protein product [Blepharisma stoltei]